MMGTSEGRSGPNSFLTLAIVSVGVAENGSSPSHTLTVSFPAEASSATLSDAETIGSPYLIAGLFPTAMKRTRRVHATSEGAIIHKLLWGEGIMYFEVKDKPLRLNY
jgi:hypothetical protein